MFKIVFCFLLLALWVNPSSADKDSDEKRKFQKNHGLKRIPDKQITKAYRKGTEIGLSVQIEGVQVDFNLVQRPVTPMDGITRQYTYGCISNSHSNIECSVTLFPNGDVWSLLAFWDDKTWICESVGNGMSMCFRSADMTENDYGDLVMVPQRREGRSAHSSTKVRRQTDAEAEEIREYNQNKHAFLEDNSNTDFGYVSHTHEARNRRALIKTVQLRMTYDTKYLQALATSQGLGVSAATIAQADTYTKMLVNHMNTIYAPQVGISFELYLTSRKPSAGASGGNYGPTTDSSTILELFTDDTKAASDDLNILLSGVDLAGSTIGVAWITGACSTTFNNGMLTPLGLFGGLYAQVSVFAHEVGHNFGCDHTPEDDHVMYFRNNGARLFGATCRKSIAEHTLTIETNPNNWYEPNCFEQQNDNDPCFTAVGDTGPCNFGLCIARGTQYTCDCDDSGYGGEKCNEPIATCPSDGVGQCQNGGKCVNQFNTYSCNCPTGFVGYFCQYESCAANPCTTGTCTDVTEGTQVTGIKTTGFKCTCSGGASGTRCENVPDGCTPDPCGGKGQCAPNTGGTCSCVDGYEQKAAGSACVDKDECASNPCATGASCTNTPGSYTCQCPSGYVLSADGTICLDNNMCAREPCGTGTCTNQPGSYTCGCSGTGFEGTNCDVDIDECSSGEHKCTQNGVCVNMPGTYRCACSEGWAGVFCDAEAGACMDEPCKNGAACIVAANTRGYVCSCPEGYAGPQCTVRIGTCADGDACMNGGACTTNVDRSYTCRCAAGYQGTRCAEEINECLTDTNTCVRENTKRCTDKFLGVQCHCKPGYGGDNCEQYTNDCGDGYPDEDFYEKVVCRCPPGYDGDRCQIPPLLDSSQGNACEIGGDQCNGRGNCRNVDIGNGVMIPQCTCFGGWDNYDCSTVTYDSCEGNPCNFGGTCQSNRNGSFKCKCVQGRTGDLCEVDVNECATSPCLVGRCSNMHNKFQCTCPAGWFGKTCNSRTP